MHASRALTRSDTSAPNADVSAGRARSEHSRSRPRHGPSAHLTAALRRRLMRLRSTALPICRVTVKPNRGLPLRPARSRRRAPWPRARTPASPSARPCGRAGIRHAVFSVYEPRRRASCCLRPCPGHWPPIAAAASHADSRLRPLARRRATTLRPPVRGHALAETVPALAHELARLVGPFHVRSPS